MALIHVCANHLPSVVFLLLLTAVALTYSFILRPLFFGPWSHVPGPFLCKLTSLHMTFYDIRLLRSQKIREWHDKYGPVILIGPGEVSVADPGATKKIYSSTAKHPKSAYFDRFAEHGERALFAARSYEEHRSKRKGLASFYRPTTVYQHSVEEFVRRNVGLVLDNLSHASSMRNPRTFSADVFKLFNYYAYDNITRLVYGPDHCSHTLKSSACPERNMLLQLKVRETWENLVHSIPAFGALLSSRIICKAMTFGKAQQSLNDAWKDLSWQCRERTSRVLRDQSSSSRATLAHAHRLKASIDTDEKSPNRTYIDAEIIDNLNAGQGTTTVSLTYMIFHLCRNRHWQEEARDELRQLPLQSDAFPAFADVDRCAVLEACLREAYRMNPASSGRAERVVPVGGCYSNVYLPAGTTISASTLALHHDPQVFPSPHEFEPSRWLNATPAELRSMEASFIPFGSGARLCLGKAFATLEVKLVLAALLLRYRMVLDVGAGTDAVSMRQLGTQDALPKALRCFILFEELGSSDVAGSKANSV